MSYNSNMKVSGTSNSLRTFRMDRVQQKEKEEKNKPQKASILRFVRRESKDKPSTAALSASNEESLEDTGSQSPTSNESSNVLSSGVASPAVTIHQSTQSSQDVLSNCSQDTEVLSCQDVEESDELGPNLPIITSYYSLSNGKEWDRSSPLLAPSSPVMKDSTISHISSRTAPLYVSPPSPDADGIDGENEVSNPFGGISMKTLLSNKTSSRLTTEMESSQDSPVLKKKMYKRLRVESDEEGIDEEEPPLKKSQLNGHSDTEDKEEECEVPDAMLLEKYIDTLESVFPSLDRMELMDALREANWNFGIATKNLNEFCKKMKAERLREEKEKRKEEIEFIKHQKLLEKEREKLEKEREKQEKERLKKFEKERARAQLKAQRIAKSKKVTQDFEEEEEDFTFESKNVYESDDSDAEPDLDLSPERRMVLNFFNEATVPELAAVPGCSKKKAEAIIQLRPFGDWEDIVYKFQTEKYVTTEFLNSAKNVLSMRSTVQKLMKRCENISYEMQNIVTRIVSGEEDAGISKQPDLLNPEYQLKSYQLIGLNWLVLMHQQGLNGVLADEMGLGKTVQAISYLAHIKEVEEPEEMSLIVVPSSTLDNWARELENWCPNLSVLLYHGSQEERKGIRMDIISDEVEEEVILTTYHMVTSCQEDRALFKKMRFHTIVLDEAHMLKNMTSQRYENLMRIKAQRRILLTGTPLQNNLVELMSILVFVMPQLFEGKKDDLKQVFSMFPKNDSCDMRGRFEQERIEQAKRIMKPFFLRRLKCDVLKDLPTKEEEVIHVELSKGQLEKYEETVAVLSKRAQQMSTKQMEISCKDVNELEEMAAVDKKSVKNAEQNSSANMLMTLRKLANHPLLLRYIYDNKKIQEMAQILKRTTHRESILEYIIEDLSVMSDFDINKTCKAFKALESFVLNPEQILDSGKFHELDKLLPPVKEKGGRVLIFSQFVMVLDILEEYLKLRNHKYLRLDGSTQVTDRQDMIDRFNEDEEIFIFLLSTRAGGLGINLTAANTVVLHDIDFNPYNDKQAEDRCHRVGQMRPVKIVRLVSKNTIEEGMYQIAQEKLQLEKDVTGQSDEQHKKGDMVALLKAALGLVKSDMPVASTATTSLETE